MRIVITGSRQSNIPGHVINSWLHDYFAGNDIITISRSHGYDFYNDYKKIINVAKTADVFVNSAAVDNFQVRFFQDLYGSVPKIISLGSIAGDFSDAIDDFYPKMKHRLKMAHKLTPLTDLTISSDILHLTLTEVENKEENISGMTYIQLKKVLDFWFENPFFSNIDLRFFKEFYTDKDKKSKIERVLKYYENK
jgi:hypothetical protein